MKYFEIIKMRHSKPRKENVIKKKHFYELATLKKPLKQTATEHNFSNQNRLTLKHGGVAV